MTVLETACIQRESTFPQVVVVSANRLFISHPYLNYRPKSRAYPQELCSICAKLYSVRGHSACDFGTRSATCSVARVVCRDVSGGHLVVSMIPSNSCILEG